jgi:predicted amidohydrolase
MRNRNDYDAILLVANWPQVRQDAWETLLKARAIENQCYVAGVNRVGKDPVCEYIGGSALYNPFGQQLVRCRDAEADAASGMVYMGMLEDFRKKFPVLEDGDDFKLL